MLGYPVTIDVAGKGALMISVAELGRCVAQEPSRNEPQSFTIVGGTGLYAGASGQGTVERLLGQTSSGASGRDWTATMNVPGLEFDIVAPGITVTCRSPYALSKTAKRARVRYRVTGLDAVDGVRPLPVGLGRGRGSRLGDCSGAARRPMRAVTWGARSFRSGAARAARRAESRASHATSQLAAGSARTRVARERRGGVFATR